MMISNQIHKFLSIQIKRNKLTRKVFASESGILYHTVCDILNDNTSTPSIMTILKIANYFHCAVDAVVGRKKYIYNNIDYNNNAFLLNNWNINLKKYINTELQRRNISAYNLATQLRLNQQVILLFLNDTKKTRTISTSTVVAIANYFQVSIDKMIGRTKDSNIY